jgi:hypothetical protein
MMWTKRGKLSCKIVSIGIVSSWEDGSSQEIASVRAMRSSMLEKKRYEERGKGRCRREEGRRRRRRRKTKSEERSLSSTESFFKEKNESYTNHFNYYMKTVIK